jgi:adenine-specific DNA-methyltransferase
MNSELAKGLAGFLNSTILDLYFRSFSGHTQVNATDLRNLRYPPKSALERIAKRLTAVSENQTEIDEVVQTELAAGNAESPSFVELRDAFFSESFNER